MNPHSVSDQSYLLTDQYRDAGNLDARIQIHKRFSTNAYGWFRWLFDQLELGPACRILELGCGPGDFWVRNRDRMPREWEITLSDFSPGMVEQARRNLGSQFAYEVIDAQSIPFDDEAFDAILACHMLYHVPDRRKALAEMHRVLRPAGQVYITTIGVGHMRGLRDLVARFDPDIAVERDDGFHAFTLENGADQIGAYFPTVALRRYDDELLVTEAAPLADYILSSTWHGVTKERREALVAFMEGELAAGDGAIRIKKDSGLFTAGRG